MTLKLSTRNVILALSISLPAMAAQAAPGSVPFFSSLYMEGVYLGQAKSVAGLANFRFGLRPVSALETYAVLRAGADTRTFLEKGDAVYNDNYLFTGAGVDYTGLLPGVRLTAQAGYSFDLSSKVNLKGFDLRTGAIGYFENHLLCPSCLQEIYSEAIYVHRYRNLVANAQWRWLYVWKLPVASHSLEIGPMGVVAASTDSKGYDYNRFLEVRAGARVRMYDWAGLSFQPQYVWGARWDRPTQQPTYGEWRFLATAYTEF